MTLSVCYVVIGYNLCILLLKSTMVDIIILYFASKYEREKREKQLFTHNNKPERKILNFGLRVCRIFPVIIKIRVKTVLEYI